MTAPVRVVRFAPAAAACVRAGDARYFIVTGGPGGAAVVNARCAHRGGPLHLGAWAADRSAVTCPMHGLSTSAARLRRGQLPTIDRGDEVVVVLTATAALAHAIPSPLQERDR